MIPKALEKQCIEKDGKKYLVIIRVPTTEMHSIALVEVVGFLPATMSNTIITDPVTQQMAGSDNDGDQRFCCTMFKPGKDGKLSEDKKLSNEALEGLISILQNPEYFELNNIPINVKYFDAMIPKGKSQKSRFSFNSFKEMWNNNSDAKRGIAIASRTNGAFNYLRKIGVKLKGLPMINGKIPTSFGISTAKERIVMATELANLTNIIVDNAKAGKMAKLGLSDATVNVYFVMRRLGIPVKDIIDIFTGTEAGQEIIQMLQEARSVASPFTKGGVFRALARKYQVPEKGIDSFNTKNMDNADVVALVKKMSDLAMETFNFSEIIRLNEDGIVNNNDYVQGQKLLRYMESMENLLNSEDSNRIIRVENSSNLTDNSIMIPLSWLWKLLSTLW